jgi:hypothetical protein
VSARGLNAFLGKDGSRGNMRRNLLLDSAAANCLTSAMGIGPGRAEQNPSLVGFGIVKHATFGGYPALYAAPSPDGATTDALFSLGVDRVAPTFLTHGRSPAATPTPRFPQSLRYILWTTANP